MNIEMKSHLTHVSESSFEYLISEIMSLNSFSFDNQRLEDMGFEVGYRLVDKLTANHKYLGNNPLDIIKFICKEFWESVFYKKVISNICFSFTSFNLLILI